MLIQVPSRKLRSRSTFWNCVITLHLQLGSGFIQKTWGRGGTKPPGNRNLLCHANVLSIFFFFFFFSLWICVAWTLPICMDLMVISIWGGYGRSKVKQQTERQLAWFYRLCWFKQTCPWHEAALIFNAFGGEDEGMEKGHNMNIPFLWCSSYNLFKMDTKVWWHFEHSL